MTREGAPKGVINSSGEWQRTRESQAESSRNAVFNKVLRALEAHARPHQKHITEIDRFLAPRGRVRPPAPIFAQVAQEQINASPDLQEEYKGENKPKLLSNMTQEAMRLFVEALAKKRINSWDTLAERPPLQHRWAGNALLSALPDEEVLGLRDMTFSVGTSLRPYADERSVLGGWYRSIIGRVGPREVDPTERQLFISRAQAKFELSKDRLISAQQDSPNRPVAESLREDSPDPWIETPEMFLGTLSYDLIRMRGGQAQLAELGTYLNSTDFQVLQGNVFERINESLRHAEFNNYAEYSDYRNHDFPLSSREDADWLLQWSKDPDFIAWKQEHDRLNNPDVAPDPWLVDQTSSPENPSRRGARLRRRVSRKEAIKNIGLAVLGLSIGAGAAHTAVVIDRSMGWGITSPTLPEDSGDYHDSTDVNNGEIPAQLPNYQGKPSVGPAPRPTATPGRPEAAPVPPVLDRTKENVEGKTEINNVVVNDVDKTVRKVLRESYQGGFSEAAKRSRQEASLEYRLMQAGSKVLIDAGALRTAQGAAREELIRREQSLKARPQYRLDLRNELPRLETAPIHPAITLDYRHNQDLTPTKIQLDLMVPLREVQGLNLAIRNEKLDGKNIDMIEMGQVPQLLRHVVDMGFLKKDVEIVETMEKDRYRISGKQASDNADVEIVAAPDGRISVVIKQLSHIARPGERPKAGVPAFP